ncbi:MAG: MinD/ParA family protein [Gammaproteobacteria bacterium]|nr:MinD/ParA family protein [Gammaproteobacteria bacterium]
MGFHPVQVIAVTGGKGGVGKTSTSVNLAIAMAKKGRRVLLMDADLGLANIDIMLGIKTNKNIADVLDGSCSIQDVVVNGPCGIKIVPASSGINQMAMLGAQEHGGLIHAFNEFSDQIDLLVIDTAAGISDTVVSFVQAAQEVLLVVCNEPASITDAYALIKLLTSDHGVFRYHILANQVKDMAEAKQLFSKLCNVTDRFLDVALDFMGMVPYDDHVKKAVKRQKAVSDVYPRCEASLAYKSLADKVDDWPLPTSPRGHLEFFVDQLAQGRQHH